MKNSLFIGIGCKRGTSADAIKNAVTETLNNAKLLVSDICCLASCDVKSDEKGLLEYAKCANLNINFYSSEELKKIQTPNPSKFVSDTIGTPSVSEASALLASREKKLIIQKQKLSGITIAVAR